MRECTNSVNYFHRLFVCLLLPMVQWLQMLKEEERPQENAKLHLIFINKQHRRLKRNLCNFGVIGISYVYAGYEREPHCLFIHSLFH